MFKEMYCMPCSNTYMVCNIQTDVWTVLTIRNLIQFSQPSGQFADGFFLQVTHFDIRNRQGAEDQKAQQYFIKLHSVFIKFKNEYTKNLLNKDIHVWCVNKSAEDFCPYVVYFVSLHWQPHSTVQCSYHFQTLWFVTPVFCK